MSKTLCKLYLCRRSGRRQHQRFARVTRSRLARLMPYSRLPRHWAVDRCLPGISKTLPRTLAVHTIPQTVAYRIWPVRIGPLLQYACSLQSTHIPRAGSINSVIVRDASYSTHLKLACSPCVRDSGHRVGDRRPATRGEIVASEDPIACMLILRSRSRHLISVGYGLCHSSLGCM